FFKPNVSAMVGGLYADGSALKDRAYNIFYMGINIGALLAPINSEWMAHRFGFNVAFAAAGVGMIFSVIILWTFKRHAEPAPRALPSWGEPGAEVRAAAAADVPGGVEDLAPAPARKVNPIDLVPDSRRIGALVVVFLIVIVFWMILNQGGSTFTYWADDNTA